MSITVQYLQARYLQNKFIYPGIDVLSPVYENKTCNLKYLIKGLNKWVIVHYYK